MHVRHLLLALLPLLTGCSSSTESSTDPDAAETDDAQVDDAVADDVARTDTLVAADGKPSDGASNDTGTATDTGKPDVTTDTSLPSGTPSFGGSSKGTGGTAPANGTTFTAGTITYRLLAPATATSQPTPLMIVFSGVEGGQQMTNNLNALGPSTGTATFIRAVIDGQIYFDDGAAGATVLDDVRSKYDVDNDRTYLLSESAGTRAGLKLGFHLRQSWFAAYWANDVNASDVPEKTAAALGFASHGQAGPGGALTHATTIVNGMKASGYVVPTPAPYDGPGSTQHGSPQQFTAAVSWFAGKSRK